MAWETDRIYHLLCEKCGRTSEEKHTSNDWGQTKTHISNFDRGQVYRRYDEIGNYDDDVPICPTCHIRAKRV